MAMADAITSNGSLSVFELHHFMAGTTYSEFVDWLLGEHKANLRKFDRGNDDELDTLELTDAYKAFVEEMVRETNLTLMGNEETRKRTWDREEKVREEERIQAELEEQERFEEEERKRKEESGWGSFY